MSGVMADRLVAALAFAVFALALTVGFVWGRWNGGKALDRADEAGYWDGKEDGWRDGWDAAFAEIRASDERECGQTVILDGSIPLRAGEPRPGFSDPAPPRALAFDAAAVPYPMLAPEVLGAPEVPRPGHENPPVSGRTEAGPGDDPPAEVGWVERQLYVDAIEIARIEAAEARAMEEFHADALAWDRHIAAWAEEASGSLVPAWKRFEQMVEA